MSKELASWVKPDDRIPLMLALSLYNSKPIEEMVGYKMVPGSYGLRFAIWLNEDKTVAIVGTRGTSPFGAMGALDLADDGNIATSDQCNLTLVGQVTKMIEKFVPATVQSIIFVGHSLGGTAALCLTSKYPNSRGIGFNSGAAPTNPILQGPGSGRFTHYHIFGDLISTHMSPEAAEVIVVKKKNASFASAAAHSSERALASDGPFEISNQTEEDEAFQKWGTPSGFQIFNPAKWAYKILESKAPEKMPIPGSARFQNK
jgi:pimeloyl-ACP methyl ester carboxylesterase